MGVPYNLTKNIMPFKYFISFVALQYLEVFLSIGVMGSIRLVYFSDGSGYYVVDIEGIDVLHIVEEGATIVLDTVAFPDDNLKFIAERLKVKAEQFIVKFHEPKPKKPKKPKK